MNKIIQIYILKTLNRGSKELGKLNQKLSKEFKGFLFNSKTFQRSIFKFKDFQGIQRPLLTLLKKTTDSSYINSSPVSDNAS